MSDLAATHPEYDAMRGDWIVMRDFYRGASAVKRKTTEYLPPTKGMLLDGMGTSRTERDATGKQVNVGQEAYNAYLRRAVFPEYVQEAVEHYLGIMHSKPATITVPKLLEPLLTASTAHGEPIDLLLRRINEEQLVSGRLGLLADLPIMASQDALPYIALYVAETVRNWDDGEMNEGNSRLNLVVLDESGYKRKDVFEWEHWTKYRVLMLGAPAANEAEGTAPYRQGAFEATGTPTFVETAMIEPAYKGSKIDFIPFVFINTKDITPTPDKPPLRALSRECETIYMAEADYRQNLFMQGQDTLVTIGDRAKVVNDPTQLTAEGPVRVGAGSMIAMEQNGDAKYIGVGAEGLGEQRTALENDRRRAEVIAGKLSIDKQQGDESGEALKTRVGAQTASLHQIAKSGAAGLEAMLKMIARWMGANESEVSVVPNLKFADLTITGRSIVELMSAKGMGAPISQRTIHNRMVDGGVTDLTLEEELEEIQGELPLVDPADEPTDNPDDKLGAD